ncbi:hypothetical protein D0867_16452 [Hortaea werneckii]|uniref:NADH-ubiquinone oxidoreductase 9.5 kDa subunit n=1 Tax=Hortaea werneckii TaxID=91943 RepID=A0A3M6WM49_HORWE|nr:hypothetical protein D0867_16452 [Hortaea werneckii]RMX94733.1 hypothetical protein D0866_16569 [Hortaea werneckii]
MAPVEFFEAPAKYFRWAIRQKPAIFWALVIGTMGPVMAFTVPPIRNYFGDGPRPQIPLTYPSKSRPTACYTATEGRIPKGPRKIPQGYDD